MIVFGMQITAKLIASLWRMHRKWKRNTGHKVIATSNDLRFVETFFANRCIQTGEPRRQPYRRSGLATLPSVVAIP